MSGCWWASKTRPHPTKNETLALLSPACMSSAELVFVVLTLTLAGFLQGVSGFGFGLAVMGLLPLVIPVQHTQAAVTVLNVVVCVYSTSA